MSSDKRKIIIGFSKPKNNYFPIFSWLIRLFEKTPYSHVYLRWYSKGANVEVAYHSAGTMVHFLSKRIFDMRVQPVEEYEVEVSKDTYRHLIRFCMENAGTGYGILQVFGMAAQRLFGFKKNPLGDGTDTQICNELVGHMVKEVIGIPVNLDLDSAGPRDINNLVTEHFKRIL